MSAARHRTVFLREAVESLDLHPGETAIDATLGAGGHTEVILETLQGKGTLLALDADAAAVAALSERCAERTLGETALHAVVGNFRGIAGFAADVGIERADGILADLGWRMEQFAGTPEEGGGKGFSFLADEPLLMTYGDPASYALTARDVVNTWGEEDIANVLFGYGEESSSRRIARGIVQARTQAPIETSGQLAEIVEAAVPRHGRTHPATRTFQALRIAVNDEFAALEEFITASVGLLASGGRLSIITFHSIEDRIVKHRFRELADAAEVRRITKKPVTPSDEELADNPRARSAKLRTIEKL